MEAGLSDADAMLAALRQCAGADAVRTDDAALALAASDVHLTGHRPLAVVRPASADALARAVHAATSRGYAVLPRGGGLSYTGGYAPPHDRCITIDTTALDRILTIAEEDLTVTAQAGVTWKALYEALRPRGLRLPFFGTFSGAGATIGGGLSHGALFLGSARYGGAADIALGLELALADGTLLRTGQAMLKRPSKPVWRGFGPDLTGLFLHDGGAFGIKTEATLRLIRTPAAAGYLSFALPSFAAAADALSAVAREGLAEEAYVLEGEAAGALADRAGAKLRGAL
ncbi:MAG: FAD-binding oxidoreductase, partial [Alphaproteobacteria bacterium]|nr:FAD-binding oxidoreductase [Alphaproteobacteria bacterium]